MYYLGVYIKSNNSRSGTGKKKAKRRMWSEEERKFEGNFRTRVMLYVWRYEAERGRQK